MITGLELNTLKIHGEGLWVESPAGNEKFFLASIFDQKGRWMASHTLQLDADKNGYHWQVDHTSWPEGIYLLVIRGERMLRQIKLVKEINLT